MKFKLIGILALALAFAGAAFGQSNPMPKLVIEKTEFNAGEIKAGEELKHDFVVKNEGTADLQILNVLPSCGCTASDFTKVIAPGKEGKISLTVHTTGFSGALSKYADVLTNDPQRAKFTLTLNMIIATSGPPVGRQVGQFIIGPSDHYQADIPRGTSAETGIIIYNNGTLPVNITKVIPGGEAFSVRLDTLEGGKRYLLNIKSDPNLAIGDHKQVVKLVIDGGQPAELPINLDLGISPPVYANPKEIKFGMLPVSQAGYDISSVAKFIWLRQTRGGGLQIKKMSATLPFIKVTVEAEENAGATFRVKIGFDQNVKVTPGLHEGVVKIETNNPFMPVVEIPVSLIAR